MSYREIPVQYMHSFTELVASSLNLQLKVEMSEHSIETTYVLPDKDNRAWDTDLFKNGNVFIKGYANPLKPRVHHNDKLENPDTVEITESDVDDSDIDVETESDTHVSLISSSRYRDYMRQDLVSQLLTPKEQWKLIAYAVIGLGVLQFLTLIAVAYVNGGI